VFRVSCIIFFLVNFSLSANSIEDFVYYGDDSTSCVFLTEDDWKVARKSLPGYMEYGGTPKIKSIYRYADSRQPYSYTFLEPMKFGVYKNCIGDSSGRKVLYDIRNLWMYYDFDYNYKTGVRDISKVYPLVLYTLRFRDNELNTVDKLDSLANYLRNVMPIKEIYTISESRFNSFYQVYKTPSAATSRKEFLINFTNRPDADSLGYLYYDSTGFSDFTKADSTFPGGIVMNRIFYSDVEPWRVVKGLRYRVTDNLKVEILAEKIFLLFQRYYYEGEICCGG